MGEPAVAVFLPAEEAHVLVGTDAVLVVDAVIGYGIGFGVIAAVFGDEADAGIVGLNVIVVLGTLTHQDAQVIGVGIGEVDGHIHGPPFIALQSFVLGIGGEDSVVGEGQLTGGLDLGIVLTGSQVGVGGVLLGGDGNAVLLKGSGQGTADGHLAEGTGLWGLMVGSLPDMGQCKALRFAAFAAGFGAGAGSILPFVAALAAGEQDSAQQTQRQNSLFHRYVLRWLDASIIKGGTEAVKKTEKVFEKDCNTPAPDVYIWTETSKEQSGSKKSPKKDVTLW